MEDNVRIQHVTETILEKLELVGAVVVSTDETDAFRVAIETEETGLLIGYHGKTLESMQAILGIIVSKELGRWVKIYVNVGDYREKEKKHSCTWPFERLIVLFLWVARWISLASQRLRGASFT